MLSPKPRMTPAARRYARILYGFAFSRVKTCARAARRSAISALLSGPEGEARSITLGCARNRGPYCGHVRRPAVDQALKPALWLWLALVGFGLLWGVCLGFG